MNKSGNPDGSSALSESLCWDAGYTTTKKKDRLFNIVWHISINSLSTSCSHHIGCLCCLRCFESGWNLAMPSFLILHESHFKAPAGKQLSSTVPEKSQELIPGFPCGAVIVQNPSSRKAFPMLMFTCSGVLSFSGWLGLFTEQHAWLTRFSLLGWWTGTLNGSITWDRIFLTASGFQFTWHWDAL